jgi:hypothetical protein
LHIRDIGGAGCYLAKESPAMLASGSQLGGTIELFPQKEYFAKN